MILSKDVKKCSRTAGERENHRRRERHFTVEGGRSVFF
jgi:hypothetical protein